VGKIIRADLPGNPQLVGYSICADYNDFIALSMLLMKLKYLAGFINIRTRGCGQIAGNSGWGCLYQAST
jgi:hypothetical protein